MLGGGVSYLEVVGLALDQLCWVHEYLWFEGELMKIEKCDSNSLPQPPSGYVSWLDYAVASMDLRSVELEAIFDDNPGPEREAMRNAVHQELEELRTKAAKLDALLEGDPQEKD